MGDNNPDAANPVPPTTTEKQLPNCVASDQSGVLYHQLRRQPLNIVGGRGSYLLTDDGLEILDATCGAAVSCLGHSDKRVHEAIQEQLQKIPYCYSLYFTNSAAESLSEILVDSTGGKMSRAFIVSSGMSILFGLDSNINYSHTTNEHRHRSRRSIPQDGRSVFHGVTCSTAPASQLHCTQAVLPWKHTWITVCRSPCRP